MAETMETIMNKTGKIATTTATTAPAVKVLTSIKAINKACADIKARGDILQADIHSVACSVLVHVAKHGQINVLTHFLDSVPDMVRKNSLQTWFETFGCVSFSALENTDEKKPSWRIDRSKNTRLADAMVKPFWRFNALEGAPYQPLDMAAFLKAAERKLQTDIDEAKKAGRPFKVQAALLVSLKKFNPATAVAN